MLKQFAGLGMVLLLGLAACGIPAASTPAAATAESGAGMGMGMGMGMSNGMHTRHSTTIPADYAGRASPVSSDDESAARGAVIFTSNCAVCHGDGGMGDGPTAASLDPSPAPIARTSLMMGDDYLFWRVSEGGVPFATAMPVWKETLDEQARWDVINYVRALGRGQVQPGHGMGGAGFDPTQQASQHAAMLAQALEQGLITQAEADTFTAVHDALDEYRSANPPAATGASPAEQQTALLAALVESGAITSAQAESFESVHQRLLDAGLMQ